MPASFFTHLGEAQGGGLTYMGESRPEMPASELSAHRDFTQTGETNGGNLPVWVKFRVLARHSR